MTQEEDSHMETDYTFDFTHQDSEPVPLFPEPAPGHPPTILARSEPLLTSRFRQVTT
ncbi:hypothetical protein [Streptomyces lincolnensis]|uniref:hypothetical protein n=1 Tax=Streptomyces lincolnensis TaxID=1915 RepID=UPI0037D0DB19